MESFRDPPRDPTPLPAEPAVEADVVAIDDPVAGVPETLSVSGSFHFMQASELETSTFEHTAEWVEKTDAEPDDVPEEQLNGLEDAPAEPAEVSVSRSSLST